MGKRGPKPGSRPKSGALGASMNLRLSPDLRDALESAASRAGRDLSDEIRTRLLASFNAVEFTVPETKGLAYTIALALEEERATTGFYWFEQAWAFKRAMIAINKVLLYFRPAGDPDTVPDDAKQLQRLRSMGLEALIPEAVKQLQDRRSAEISGQFAVLKIEHIATGGFPGSESLKPVAQIVKKLLEALGNDTAAQKEIIETVRDRERGDQ